VSDDESRAPFGRDMNPDLAVQRFVAKHPDMAKHLPPPSEPNWVQRNVAPMISPEVGVALNFMGPRIPGVGGGMPKSFKLPGGREVETAPIEGVNAARSSYMKSQGMKNEAPFFEKVDPDRASRIAGAYDEMRHAPNDPKVKASYDALAAETLAQYKALRGQGYEFQFMGKDADGNIVDPYAKSPALGYEDLAKNKRLQVFPTEAGFGSSDFAAQGNPLLAQSGETFGGKPATYNDLFRAVHDAYGHFGSGNAFFRAPGEERAWQSHQMMYSPKARGAMTSETRGQNSWVNYGPHGEANRGASGANTVYADQKTGVMPRWTQTEGAPIGDPGMSIPAAPPFAEARDE
jgi:hypothetical protein